MDPPLIPIAGGLSMRRRGRKAVFPAVHNVYSSKDSSKWLLTITSTAVQDPRPHLIL